MSPDLMESRFTDESHLDKPIVGFVRTDIPVFDSSLTVQDALELVRETGLGERIFYFYAVNKQQQLVGVIPTRRLLCSKPDCEISKLMVTDVFCLPSSATVRQACFEFLTHKFLALPVVDDEKHILGIVDIGFFSEEQVNSTERQHIADMFQILGVSVAEVETATPVKAFRYRMPGLIATIIGGTLCAILAGFYQITLEKMIVLAFFMTLVTGLSESVSMQSMTIAIQHLHTTEPTWKLYRSWLKSEFANSLLLSTACGMIVGITAVIWFHAPAAAAIIGISIFISMIISCIIGISVPTLLHALHEDSKIAAGPVTLAATDVITVSLYLKAAAIAILLSR